MSKSNHFKGQYPLQSGKQNRNIKCFYIEAGLQSAIKFTF